MATSPDQLAAPPVEALLAEVVVALGSAAHGYLDDESASESQALPSAEAAIDVAAYAFERVRTRLKPEESTVLGQILTEARMKVVRKRGG